MPQPTSKRLVTEATVAGHVAAQITTPGTPAATALNATYAPASGSPSYTSPQQAAGLSAALSIVFGG